MSTPVNIAAVPRLALNVKDACSAIGGRLVAEAERIGAGKKG
jgi:hypothetical protein